VEQFRPTKELPAVSPAALTLKEQHTVSAAVGAALSDTKQRDLPVVLSRAHVGILHRDLQRRVLVVNDAFCALVGRSKKELNGLPFELFTHPDDAERSRLIYERQFAKAEPFEIEKRYVRPDGTTVYCAVHVSFVLDESGAPESTITVASDITARHRAECELRETEQHYRHAVELNPQIAWTAAPDGAINSVSPRWQALTGVPVSKALGDG
jgi:PAS domain S-box-containing protein